MAAHLFSLLTALLAASSAVAAPRVGHHNKVLRRCAAAAAAAAGSVSVPNVVKAEPPTNVGVGGEDNTDPWSVYVAVGGGDQAAPPAGGAGASGTNHAESASGPPSSASTGSSASGTTPANPDTSGDDAAAVTGPAGNAAGNAGGKDVFAHFMIGITSTYTQPDYEKDMRLAAAYGISAFALNVGTDPYTKAQLDLAYAAAQAVGFKVFISFDFNWFKVSDGAGPVVDIFKAYVNHPAQLKVHGAAFVSTFIGQGLDWNAVEAGVGHKIYAVPHWPQNSPDASTGLAAVADAAELGKRGTSGLFSWHAWPGQPDNKPTPGPLGTAHDETYLDLVTANNQVYMAPVSPWFFTHFGKEVSYSKNFLFKSDRLWVDRWNDMLKLGDKLKYIEIVTWNDYGESHHVGPYNTPHTDDGASKWADGLDHLPMLDLAKPFITAFKNGASAPVVDKEGLVYWYRPHPKDVMCDATDNCGSKPLGADLVSDTVFVALMTKAGGSATIVSGANAAVTVESKGGIEVFEVPMGVGEQTFSFKSSSGAAAEGKGTVPISSECWTSPQGAKIYNYNFHAGLLD